MRNNILVACFVLITACNYSDAQKIGGINATNFEVKANTGVQVLDVRTAEEYSKSHIKDALQADWLNKKQFAERIQHLDKSKSLLVYCASGVRSAQAMRWLAQQGFTEVYNLQDGLTGWKIEGKPLVTEVEVPQMLTTAFDKSIQTNQIVLVDVGAAWCPPCKKMEPELVRLQKEIGNKFLLLKVDGGNDVDVMKHIRAVGLPTFIVYKNGKETWRQQGIVAYDQLKKAIE